MAAITTPLPPCPACGATGARVEEDVSDEVTVLACDRCAQTWAVRAPNPHDRSGT